MIGYILVAFVLSVAQAQYLDTCPPENIEVANFRLMTRDLPPIGVPNVARMDKDVIYAVEELQNALEGINFTSKIELPADYNTDPFIDRCCDKATYYNCTRNTIELRYVRYQNGICWVVWPGDFFFEYTRCTCCSCVINDECPVVGRCVETDYNTIKVISYCPHIMYNSRYQKMAIRIPTSCKCAASCPVPQHYFYKKRQTIW